jgi:hypothetical protein
VYTVTEVTIPGASFTGARASSYSTILESVLVYILFIRNSCGGTSPLTTERSALCSLADRLEAFRHWLASLPRFRQG